MSRIAIAPNEVHDAVRASLYDDDTGDIPADEPIVAPGIVRTFAFKPDRLERQRPKVVRWLMALPHEFRIANPGTDGGGGWSFLNACVLSDGTQWTGEHSIMEELFCLALGLHLALVLGDRELWTAMPGGMPYYVILVDDDGEIKGGGRMKRCRQCKDKPYGYYNRAAQKWVPATCPTCGKPPVSVGEEPSQ